MMVVRGVLPVNREVARRPTDRPGAARRRSFGTRSHAAHRERHRTWGST
jgi:hypothetical protein